MTTIQCKTFYSMKCGHSRRYLDTSWKKLQKEYTEYEGHTIEFQGIENIPENSDIFKLYGINSYPKTFLSYEHADGTRRLEAVSGNAPYEKCQTMFTEALAKILTEKEEWDKHFEKVTLAKKAEMEERRLMGYARAFLKKPDVMEQLKAFADYEEKIKKERFFAKKALEEEAKKKEAAKSDEGCTE